MKFAHLVLQSFCEVKYNIFLAEKKNEVEPLHAYIDKDSHCAKILTKHHCSTFEYLTNERNILYRKVDSAVVTQFNGAGSKFFPKLRRKNGTNLM